MFNRIKNLESKVDYLATQYIDCDECGAVVKRDKIVTLLKRNDPAFCVNGTARVFMCRHCAIERREIIPGGTIIENNDQKLKIINDCQVEPA